MKRRKFAQSALTVLGVSSLPIGLTMANDNRLVIKKSEQQLFSDDGLKLTLTNHSYGTKDKDEKQFILTYDVENTVVLEEKVYQVKTTRGKAQQLYMTPINKHQLQAVFNWRTHA